MSELSDEQVDAELSTAIYGYDPRDKYPEWSHAQMRDAYRAGREDALAEHRELLTVRSVEELDALPDDTAVLVDDCPARKHLGDWYFANDDGDGYGSKSLALYLPALVLYRPDWDTP